MFVRRLSSAFTYAVVALACNSASAQTTDPDTFTETIIARTQDIGDNLQGVALSLLIALSLINVVWVFGRLVLGGADINDMGGRLVQFALFTGVALLLVQNGSAIAGFVLENAGAISEQAAPNLSTKPGELFAALLRMAGLQVVSSLNPLNAVFGAIAAFIIAGFAAGIVAYIVIAIIEIHLVAGIGILLLGFLGWEVTADVGKRFLYFALGSALKLVTTFIIAGVLQEVVATWTTFSVNPLDILNAFDNLVDTLSIVALVIISFMMIGTIPNNVMSMVSGASYSSSAESGLGVGKLAVAVAALAAVKVGGPAIAGAIGSGGAGGGAGALSSAVSQTVGAAMGGKSGGGGGDGKASPAVVSAINKAVGDKS